MSYIGTPIDTQNQFQSLQGKRFSGDGSTTAFTLDIAPSSVFDIEVFVENVRQDPNSAYGISGTTLTFTGAPPSGTNNIYVVHQAKAVGTIDVPASGVVPASLASNIISGQTELAATPADTDEFLISDGGTIKRIDFSHIKGQGKIAQVVTAVKTNTTSSSSTSYTEVGLNISITPSATSSKVLLMFNPRIGSNTGSANILMKIRNNTAGSDVTADPFAVSRWPSDGQSAYYTQPQPMIVLDSPSTSSSVTYQLQMKTNAGGFTVNMPSNTGGYSDTEVSTVIAMEVLA